MKLITHGTEAKLFLVSFIAFLICTIPSADASNNNFQRATGGGKSWQGGYAYDSAVPSSFTAREYFSGSTNTITGSIRTCFLFYETDATKFVHISTYSGICGGTPENCSSDNAWPIYGGQTVCNEEGDNVKVYVHIASGNTTTSEFKAWRKK